ncbi:putative glycolipid-binding domain-containing protein [Piscinibacter koreensis]|uniref:Putative glycolipid-binding domain-containing protein n=1 Tax=Piscinibacter koreensis TaxID=2742824 RepID=A0A7Y6TWA7_9BURK|nr:putative glycolipid-binding domain-containing protein [Schlegelella koreensis]NUZ05796.1 putative glycolipid-binding domain-containing protein [Schlegelella koreensis]
MRFDTLRHVCWTPIWNADHSGIGLEHVVLTTGSADSTLLAIDEDGEPFRLTYRLAWDHHGLLRRAELRTHKGAEQRRLLLRVDAGRWTDHRGEPLHGLDGCTDIDIWPTPLTNSFPIWRSALQIGERREFRMAWVAAPGLTVEARAQAYTRQEEHLFVFESLDETGFKASLAVDNDGLVVDYPGLFRRVALRR